MRTLSRKQDVNMHIFVIFHHSESMHDHSLKILHVCLTAACGIDMCVAIKWNNAGFPVQLV